MFKHTERQVNKMKPFEKGISSERNIREVTSNTENRMKTLCERVSPRMRNAQSIYQIPVILTPLV